jgi:hypothetical protein
VQSLTLCNARKDGTAHFSVNHLRRMACSGKASRGQGLDNRAFRHHVAATLRGSFGQHLLDALKVANPGADTDQVPLGAGLHLGASLAAAVQ